MPWVDINTVPSSDGYYYNSTRSYAWSNIPIDLQGAQHYKKDNYDHTYIQ